MSPTESIKIEKQILIRAPRARVWRAISDASEFGRWFGVAVEGVFQQGARPQMTSTQESCKGVVFHVEIERMEPERLLAWRWHPGMPDASIDYSKEPTTLVEFRLEDAEGGTLLTVVESGFERISLTRRAAVLKDNEGGWEYQVHSIERYVSQTP